MKKIILILGFLIATLNSIFSQVNEGYIVYDIEMTAEIPEMEQAVSMFESSSMYFYFLKEKARSDLNFGTIMSVSSIFDFSTNEVLYLIKGILGNNAVLTNLNEINNNNDSILSNYKVTITNEEKKILNFVCKKAIIMDKEGNESEYWFTNSIGPNLTDKTAPISLLPGLALEYTIKQSGIIMFFTASKFNFQMNDGEKNDLFSLKIPKGFDKISYEKFKSMGRI